MIHRRLVMFGLTACLGLACHSSGPGDPPELDRELATRLQSVGVDAEAARYFERYLERTETPSDKKAPVALALARILKDDGQLERALGWLYRVEQWSPGSPSAKEAGPLIVACLDRLGKGTAAQTALKSRSGLKPQESAQTLADSNGAGPTLALINGKPFTQAEFNQALDALPPEARASLRDPAQRRGLLEQLVARELLYGKAVTRGLDSDPQVRRQVEAMTRELTIARLLESELKDKVKPAESDLRNFYEANKDRFKGKDGTLPPFESIAQAVGQAYWMSRAQSLSQDLLRDALAAQEVQLFPQALEGSAAPAAAPSAGAGTGGASPDGAGAGGASPDGAGAGGAKPDGATP